MRMREIAVCLICLVGVLPGLSSLYGQKLPDEPVTMEELQRRIRLWQSNTELPAELKEKALSYLQGAVERLEIAQENTEKAVKFEQQLQSIEENLALIQKKLQEVSRVGGRRLEVPRNTEELALAVQAREKELEDPLNGLHKQIADLDAESAQWRTRPEELINHLAAVQDRIREIQDEEEAVPTSGEQRELIPPHLLFLEARRQRAETELRVSQAEAGWYQSSRAADLLQARQELAAKTLAVKNAELEQLQNELAKRRGDEADQQVRHAEETLASVVPELKKVAEENVNLAREQRDITGKLRDVERRHEATSASLAELKKEFDRTQQMVEDVGLTDTIGLLLRQQRSKLVDQRTLRSNLAHRNDVVRESRMRLFYVSTQREALIDLEGNVARRALELELPRSADRTELQQLLTEQRQLYKAVESEYTRYFKQLIEMDVIERRLLELATEYAAYVDERVLWIRTGTLFGRDHFLKAIDALPWLINPDGWQAVVDTAWKDFNRRPIPWVIAIGLFAIWLVACPAWYAVVQRDGGLAAQAECREMLPTLEAMFYTLLMAAGVPLLSGFIGWRLDHSSVSNPFVHAVASGLWHAALFAFPLELLRMVCMREGLAQRHFDWSPDVVDRWKANLNWFVPVGVLLIGAVGMIEGTGDERRIDSAGRFLFLIVAGISGVFNLLTIRRSARAEGIDESSAGVPPESDQWSTRFWRFAPIVTVMLCAGLLVLAWSGFFYTALQLTWRVQKSAIWIIGLLLVRAVVRRWIALERRRMAMLQAAEMQSMTEARREPGNVGHNQFLFPRWNWPELRFNLKQVVSQMRRLLDTGLMTIAAVGMWLVWADVTPALNILDGVTLWQTSVSQSVAVDEGDQGTQLKTVSQLRRVTAADLGLAILVLGIAVVAGRNVPGLVEVILLEHPAVDAGLRFAATCLVRYAIFIVGVCCAFAQISIGWSNVQWLVAGASVGLGFGLQEIFGNFVSGLILLFERPMRVGDVVTIGGTTGTVSRIRFRATTIVDGDRKELIVPNKEFITGHLLNWTLSDRVNRVAVKVVVPARSDPQQVRRVLLEIANQHPLLLRDPAPTATLEDVVGGLTFMLRGFLPTLDSRSTALHELHTMINHRFKAEGIELSGNPQDIVLRMPSPGTADVVPADPQPPVGGGSLKSAPIDFSGTLRRA